MINGIQTFEHISSSEVKTLSTRLEDLGLTCLSMSGKDASSIIYKLLIISKATEKEDRLDVFLARRCSCVGILFELGAWRCTFSEPRRSHVVHLKVDLPLPLLIRTRNKPGKMNLEPENGPLEDTFPLQPSGFPGSTWVSSRA